jgi:hypothetical protein
VLAYFLHTEIVHETPDKNHDEIDTFSSGIEDGAGSSRQNVNQLNLPDHNVFTATYQIFAPSQIFTSFEQQFVDITESNFTQVGLDTVTQKF